MVVLQYAGLFLGLVGTVRLLGLGFDHTLLGFETIGPGFLRVSLRGFGWWFLAGHMLWLPGLGVVGVGLFVV